MEPANKIKCKNIHDVCFLHQNLHGIQKNNPVNAESLRVPNRVFTDKLTSLVTVCTCFVYGVTTSEIKFYFPVVFIQGYIYLLSTTFNIFLIYVVNL